MFSKNCWHHFLWLGVIWKNRGWESKKKRWKEWRGLNGGCCLEWRALLRTSEKGPKATWAINNWWKLVVSVGHLQQLGVGGTPGLLPSHPGYLVEGNNSSKSQTPSYHSLITTSTQVLKRPRRLIHKLGTTPLLVLSGNLTSPLYERFTLKQPRQIHQIL